jgi:hypothetical protein
MHDQTGCRMPLDARKIAFVSCMGGAVDRNSVAVAGTLRQTLESAAATFLCLAYLPPFWSPTMRNVKTADPLGWRIV